MERGGGRREGGKRGSHAAVGDLHLAEKQSQVPSLPPGKGCFFAPGDRLKGPWGPQREV